VNLSRDNVKAEIEKWAIRFVRELEDYVRLKQDLSFDEIFNKNWCEIE